MVHSAPIPKCASTESRCPRDRSRPGVRDHARLLLLSVRSLLVGILLLVGSSEPSRGQGAIAALRDRVRVERKKPKPPESEENFKEGYREGYSDGRTDFGGGRRDRDSDSEASTLLGSAIVGLTTSPFWLPPMIMDDDYGQIDFFRRYPYQHDSQGFMAPEEEAYEPYPWFLRFRGEYLDDFDDLSRIGGRLLFDTATRFGADLEINRWDEQVLSRPPDEWSTDNLWTGDANLLFRFAQNSLMQMRAGVGMNWLVDSQDTNAGLNFTYSTDIFPCNPWILSAELDGGWLGHAGYFHARGTIGVHFHRLEFYGGYDYFDAGGVQFAGPLVGVGVWY